MEKTPATSWRASFHFQKRVLLRWRQTVFFFIVRRWIGSIVFVAFRLVRSDVLIRIVIVQLRSRRIIGRHVIGTKPPRFVRIVLQRFTSLL
ncbi:hypothetical protein ASC75_20755 [Aminobacter sp. DSM 101952]|nr:hypothetical protein ASC75_20755 [Aminobacter sp. DSM 101952]